MNFKHVQNIDKVYKDKNSLKARNTSNLEFQLRILDLVLLQSTPFMEKLNFIKIVCSNLEEFISVRLPKICQNKLDDTISSIENIYNIIGNILLMYNEKYSIILNYQKSNYKIIPNKSFEYIYTGANDIDVIYEMADVLEIKNSNLNPSILYSGEEPDIDADCFIQVPSIIFYIEECINKYSSVKELDKHYNEFKENYAEYDYYEYLKNHDHLIRAPYDSYKHVLDFIDQMCTNKNITTVFITLYRTADDSKIIQSLLKAKTLGKRVFVYIEPTARENEKSNLKNIITLKEKGIIVKCNYYNYKVHSKLFCAIDTSFRKYVHIGTGNYNEDTAKFYTDTHLLTTDESIGCEALRILSSIFYKKVYLPHYVNLNLFSSPLNFRRCFNELIDKEIEKGINGRILIKCNNLCDCGIIDKLYRAADEGVNVKIICRTGCSIYPKNNLEIRSKVGRFLEHDRIYVFGDDVYISSADLLLRNISKRVEIMCKVNDSKAKYKVLNTFYSIWDTEHIHELLPSGRWKLRS